MRSGFAWGSRLKGEDRVALTLFGDGATSEGAFHEGATFAGVMKAPVVLLCNNNQWAISTPLSKQTAAPTLADKAIGYGMPGVRVDGGDVLAVYEATRDAALRARAGRRADVHRGAVVPRGPARDRRRSVASTSTPSASRRSARTSASAATSATCAASASSSDADVEEIKQEALELMRAGIAQAEAEPPADPALVFEHAYADPPPSQANDLAELRRILAGEPSAFSSRQ